MKPVSRAQAITRWGAVAFMATAVITATAGGFAQSYAGLYHWALEHGLRGWKADSFPLLVDLFIIVGELGLFLLAIDAYVIRRKQLLSWLDFFLPLTIALAGWTTSLIFNVGHVGSREFSYQATAAVPPVVSMLGLFVLLRTLHRYVSQKDEPDPEPEKPALASAERATGPLALHQITLLPVGFAAQPRAALASAGIPGAEAPAKNADAADTAAQEPPVRAEQPVSVAANGNGQSPNGRRSAPLSGLASQAAAAPAAAATRTAPKPAEPAAPAQPDAETMRGLLLDALTRHHGDVQATYNEMAAEGYFLDAAEVSKARENHWFPYAVYRLLAKHGRDGERIAAELTGQGIEFDRDALDALVRSWRM